DERFHRADGTESSQLGRASRLSALYRLRQQLSGAEGLHARVRQPHPERVRTGGRARESGGGAVLLAQAVLASRSGPQQNQPPRIRELLSILAERSSTERLSTGGADLTGGARPHHCKAGQKGRFFEVLGPFCSSTNNDKLSGEDYR